MLKTNETIAPDTTAMRTPHEPDSNCRSFLECRNARWRCAKHGAFIQFDNSQNPEMPRIFKVLRDTAKHSVRLASKLTEICIKITVEPN